jgi:hypothetical protein
MSFLYHATYAQLCKLCRADPTLTRFEPEVNDLLETLKQLKAAGI